MKKVKLGRPKEIKDGRKINLYLDSATIDHLKQVGSGAVSRGIRILVIDDIRENKKIRNTKN